VGIVVRRVFGVIVGSVALAASLSGCLLPIDSAAKHVRYTNNSSQDVVVVIEGLSDEFPTPVASKGSYPYGISKCQGTGIRVENASGEVLGRVNAQACPDWTLTINDDGSLVYVRDE
jgi:hypothetical protein